VLRRALAPAPGYDVSQYLVEANGTNGNGRYDNPPKADLFLYTVPAASGLTGGDVAKLEHLYLLARPRSWSTLARGAAHAPRSSAT